MDLIETYLEGDLTIEESGALREWLRAKPEHAKRFVIAVHQHRATYAYFEAFDAAKRKFEK